MRIPLSTLYITYEQSDRLGYLMAWTSSIPYFILFFMIAMVIIYWIHISINNLQVINTKSLQNSTSIWIWHEESPIIFFRWLLSSLLGQICCEILAMILKEIFKSERPILSDRIHIDYGNPSSHTQFIAFFVTIYLLRLISRWNRTPKAISFIFASILIGLIPLVAFSRLYLHYHFLYQVITAIFIGVIFAIFWNRNVTNYYFIK